ncbi:serine O-acetyltransferase EpsC [Mobilicoccus sp.]|uniref:serine O-acetyltransferase EpsC n=1 Tax=Mobilicoccus sp. TaxID=2034349 RepID=UPI00289636A5|nr:serine O-acetyltransferase EpsC [Mobilicoccus sp.]
MTTSTNTLSQASSVVDAARQALPRLRLVGQVRDDSDSTPATPEEKACVGITTTHEDSVLEADRAARPWWRRVADAVVEDLDAAVERDPAATSRAQMALVSPGLHAIWAHRVAHSMWQREKLRIPARLLSNVARTVTGTEIHPGATVGRRFFIDHGMGVVIGETAEIGDDVMLYQGVTLGGRTLNKGKRHPTLGNGITVGAGAKILGAVTLGDGSQIGANSVVVKDVAPNHVATGIPAKTRVLSGEEDPVDAMFADPALWI